MVKATSQVVHEVLERCSLVVYQTRSISSDRDTGNTVKKGAKTVKEVVTTFDAGVLKAINAEKQKGARLCQQFGTKVESLAAWLVPNDRVEALLEGLTAIKDRVVVLTEDLASNIANLVESYALINPDQQDLIRTMGPGPEEVRKSTRILFAAYRVRPDEVVADAGGFSEDLELLHVQALHEFNMVLKDAKANPSGQYFTQGIRDVLGRIGMKANSLGFLHPVLAEIGRTIDDCLKNLPVDRYVDGYHAIALGSLLGQLMDPKLMLSQGGFKKLDFNQASQLTAQQEVAPKGRKKVVEARVFAADEAPDRPGDDECGGDIADRLMRRLAIVDDEEVEHDATHQAPVKDAHERVPHPYGKIGMGWHGRGSSGGRMAAAHCHPVADHLRSSSAPVSGLK